MNSYPVEELVRLTVAFTNALDQQPADPTTVTLAVTPPNDTEIIYDSSTIVRDSIGNYHYDLDINLAGLWLYRWQGVGAVVASSGNEFFQAV